MDTGIVLETFDESKVFEADQLLDRVVEALKLGQDHQAMGLLLQIVSQNTVDLKKLKSEQVIQVVKNTSVVKRLATPTSSFDLRLPTSEVSIISKPQQGEVSILFVPSLTYARTLRNELARVVGEIDKAFGFDKKKKA